MDPCDPSTVVHGYCDIPSGQRIHFVEKGEGFPLILCHGFPELWFSWRYQISALSAAGYRVIAPDQRGYGESSAPERVEAYTMEHICNDLVGLLDALGIRQAVFIGHDWGGSVVWNMAVHHPTRVKAVAGVNTPMYPNVNKSVDPLAKMKANPKIYDYQLYFVEEGTAEKELEADISRTFRILFRGSGPEEQLPTNQHVDLRNVRQRGGMLVGYPDDPAPSRLLDAAALNYYVLQYKRSGFRGPLNWYRNITANWKWNYETAFEAHVTQPALMVTTGRDPMFPPSASKPMEKYVANLSRAHIEDCGHWTQLEKPDVLNDILIRWLRSVIEYPLQSKL